MIVLPESIEYLLGLLSGKKKIRDRARSRTEPKKGVDLGIVLLKASSEESKWSRAGELVLYW